MPAMPEGNIYDLSLNLFGEDLIYFVTVNGNFLVVKIYL